MTNKEAQSVIMKSQKCLDRVSTGRCEVKCKACDLMLSVEEINEAYNVVIKVLEDLPSAQPDVHDRRAGKWIYLMGVGTFECSVCGRQMIRNIFNYCPWCGADMRGE